MENFQIGNIIISKVGRDKGKIFIVVKIEKGYVYLADGKLRKIQNPKKKKIKHVQPTNKVINNLKTKIENEEKITNADIRKELSIYQNNPGLS
jgi:ribosomal protein L14E/L6E/L27E